MARTSPCRTTLGQGEACGWAGAVIGGNASLGQTETIVQQPADLIVTNARILTMDEGNPRAEAIAIHDGTILAIGDRKTIDAFKGPSTRVIDAGGNSAVPGFIEAHMHL